VALRLERDRQLPAGVRLPLDPFHLGMVEPMTKMFSSLYSLAGWVSQPRRGRSPRYRGPSCDGFFSRSMTGSPGSLPTFSPSPTREKLPGEGGRNTHPAGRAPQVAERADRS